MDFNGDLGNLALRHLLKDVAALEVWGEHFWPVREVARVLGYSPASSTEVLRALRGSGFVGRVVSVGGDDGAEVPASACWCYPYRKGPAGLPDVSGVLEGGRVDFCDYNAIKWAVCSGRLDAAVDAMVKAGQELGYSGDTSSLPFEEYVFVAEKAFGADVARA